MNRSFTQSHTKTVVIMSAEYLADLLKHLGAISHSIRPEEIQVTGGEKGQGMQVTIESGIAEIELPKVLP